MNFLADESCGGPVIRALREAGHDMAAISEVAVGAADDEVLERALNEKRVLITEDRDFGELVYARGRFWSGFLVAYVAPSQPQWSRPWRSWAPGYTIRLR